MNSKSIEKRASSLQTYKLRTSLQTYKLLSEKLPLPSLSYLKYLTAGKFTIYLNVVMVSLFCIDWFV